MAEYLTNDTELKSIANAIRTKSGKTGNLSYPSGFVSTIQGIASNCTATAGDIKTGKTAWVGNAKVTGNMSGKSAETYNTSTSDRTISGGQYLSGAQTIKGVSTSNISAGNIKANVNVKVGDANSAGRIANVTGTFTSDGTAGAGDILSGKVGYVNGNKVTGNIPSTGATTYNASTSDQTITSGRYLSGAQTIRRVTTSNISAGNIKKGVTIQVGDSGSATRIANVTGTCPQCTIMGSDCVPFMFARGIGWTGWENRSNPSSSYAAQRADGYCSIYTYTSSSSWSFVVPTNITLTFYKQSDTNNTSTLTLNAGTWYTLKGANSSSSYQLAIYQGSTLLNTLYKYISWAYA